MVHFYISGYFQLAKFEQIHYNPIKALLNGFNTWMVNRVLFLPLKLVGKIYSLEKSKVKWVKDIPYQAVAILTTITKEKKYWCHSTKWRKLVSSPRKKKLFFHFFSLFLILSNFSLPWLLNACDKRKVPKPDLGKNLTKKDSIFDIQSNSVITNWLHFVHYNYDQFDVRFSLL
jgi:hypothetical protein